jgi:hypothetical protein
MKACALILREEDQNALPPAPNQRCSRQETSFSSSKGTLGSGEEGRQECIMTFVLMAESSKSSQHMSISIRNPKGRSRLGSSAWPEAAFSLSGRQSE